MDTNTATVKEGVGAIKIKFEIALPLKKKHTFFREEQGIASQINLLIVCFNLGKIGVKRKIECQVAGETVFSVESNFGYRFFVMCVFACGFIKIP